MDYPKNGSIFVLFALAIALLIAARAPVSEKYSIGAAKAQNSNVTTITITGKTLTVTAADGYTPTITSGEEVPMIILERTDDQVQSEVFDTITVIDE